MNINHRDRQPSWPRLQGTVLQKTASIPSSEGVRQCPVYWWWSCNYVILRQKRNFITFQDVWWVSISITTHYNNIHMIINCLDRGKTWETVTSSTWHVLSRLFKSCSAGFLCELQAVRWRCFGLCESPSAENWQTTAPVKMQRRCVKWASVNG